MKRQPYFPRAVAARPEWFGNLANELPGANATLGLDATGVADIVKDAQFLAYASGAWLTAAREFGPAATAGLREAYSGSGAAAMALPVFTPPPLGGAVAVPPGALDRIFKFVQTIKSAPAYTEAIGLQLGIVGEEDGAENPLPTFTITMERGGGTCECVRIVFNKYGRDGVVIQSRRGDGDWELLAIDLSSPYLDDRPLLAAGQPEVREYRLQYYEDAAASGGFTNVASVTVAP